MAATATAGGTTAARAGAEGRTATRVEEPVAAATGAVLGLLAAAVP